MLVVCECIGVTASDGAMKKFTFKGVLEGFRQTVQQQAKVEQEIPETLRAEHFQLRKVREELLVVYSLLILNCSIGGGGGGTACVQVAIRAHTIICDDKE